jgi:hypothetical protein
MLNDKKLVIVFVRFRAPLQPGTILEFGFRYNYHIYFPCIICVLENELVSTSITGYIFFDCH